MPLLLFFFLKNKEKELNSRSAYLHLLSDALVSAGVVASGIIIYFTNWFWLDSVSSLAIAIVILYATWGMLRDSFHLSLDAVPKNVEMEKIKEAALAIKGVEGIHHIHIWAMSTSENALTAHLLLKNNLDVSAIETIKNELRHTLQHLEVHHATLETEFKFCTEDKC